MLNWIAGLKISSRKVFPWQGFCLKADIFFSKTKRILGNSRPTTKDSYEVTTKIGDDV